MMNDIEKRAIRRWLVVELVMVFRARNNNEYPDDEVERGVFMGRESTLLSVARHFFDGWEAIQMLDEAEKEATY